MEKIFSHTILFFILLSFMLLLDFIWLKFIVGDFFQRQIGFISNIENGKFVINIGAAVFVYVLMTIALMIFVLPLAQSYPKAIMYGALFGFILYGVFDGTNLSFIKDYPIKFMIVDIFWGTFLLGVSTPFALYLTKFFN